MRTMKIKIKNSTNLKELRLRREWEEELPDGSTVSDLLAKLDLERLEEEDGSLSTLVIMEKNGKAIKSIDEELKDKDQIEIMPRLMR